MDEVRVLFVEDEDHNFEIFRDHMQEWFEREFGELMRLNIRRATDVPSALEEGRNHNFHLVFIDLQLSDDPEKREGLQLISRFKRSSAVVVLTHHARAREDAERLAADRFLVKEDIIRAYVKDIWADLFFSLIFEPRRCELPWGKLVTVSDVDLLGQFAIQQVGRGGLYRLISQATGHAYEQMTIRSVNHEEYTGTIVLEADVLRRGDTTVREKLLVKLSQQSFADELEGAQVARDGFRGFVMDFASVDPRPFRRWHAIVATHEEHSSTLDQWLLDEVDEDRIRAIMGSLVTRLRRAHQKTLEPDENKSPQRQLLDDVSTWRRARVVLACKDLEKLQPCCNVLDLATGPVLNLFPPSETERPPMLMDRRIEDFKGTTLTCVTHGDLQAQNVLVDSATQYIALMDAADSARRHPCADPARLLVSMFMSCVGAAEDTHRWQHLEQWRDLCVGFYDLKVVAGAWLPEPMQVAFREILQNATGALSDGHPAIDRLEFCLAVALEFLKASSYTNYPAPKRCIALHAGKKGLHVAAQRP